QKRVISVNFEHHRFNVVGFDLLVVAKSDRLLETFFYERLNVKRKFWSRRLSQKGRLIYHFND
ncbi:MAG: hypothetical protein COZ36_08745, partial [Piscirickettsiaceae bacterium CG_4_10_14_3_um_filter_44_349]